MKMVDFSREHVAQAMELALAAYKKERGHVPALPEIDIVPDLTPYADNGLGVAAFDGGVMVGFLCCRKPFKNSFNTLTPASGVWSPMGANAAVGGKRAEVYARMYQAAAEKWDNFGVDMHAICLYAHDYEAQRQMFLYGFGSRTVDAVRGIDGIEMTSHADYSLSELSPEDIRDILPLEKFLLESYRDSPFFMCRDMPGEDEFISEYNEAKPIYLVARHNGRVVAHIRAELGAGETFIRELPGYVHVNGGYCLPEHRGKGLNKNLLGLLALKLKAQGYARLGVDYESINTSGSLFWQKFFTPYTYGVVRWIDKNTTSSSI